MFTASFVFLAVVLTLPLVFLLWLTETEQQKVRRLYASDRYSQRQLSDHLNISRYKVRKYLAAA